MKYRPIFKITRMSEKFRPWRAPQCHKTKQQFSIDCRKFDGMFHFINDAVWYYSVILIINYENMRNKWPIISFHSLYWYYNYDLLCCCYYTCIALLLDSPYYHCDK